MPPTVPQNPPYQRMGEHLKLLLLFIGFVFSLGVGYQRLESKIAAVEQKTASEKEHLRMQLDDIKTKLTDIEHYLREKR